MTASESTPTPPGASFGSRVYGALRLDASAFADVETHPRALAQAAALVVAAGLARGLGAAREEGLLGLLGSPVMALILWLVAGVLIWGIGVRRFGYPSDYPELLRTIGFAASPLLLLVFCALPLGWFASALWAAAHAWATLALVVAVREALDVALNRALIVCALALLTALAALFTVGLIFFADPR